MKPIEWEMKDISALFCNGRWAGTIQTRKYSACILAALGLAEECHSGHVVLQHTLGVAALTAYHDARAQVVGEEDSDANQ